MATFCEHLEEPEKVLIVSKASAARGQLETAIRLWFDSGDPVSIHTLAVAANDCYHTMGKQHGSPSPVQEFIKSKSKGYQEKTREPQNFFKHGWKNLKGKVRYAPKYGEILMYDSAACHDRLFGSLPPLMRLFVLRFTLSHPFALKVDAEEYFLKGIKIHNLRELKRSEFLERVLPVLAETA
jgi:hypothetical protein